MTPKEKAQELVDKFIQGSVVSMGDMLYYHPMPYSMAKQCAIIAVDEILKSAPLEPSDTDWDDCGGSFQYWYPQKRDDTDKFWQEVRTELEKL